MLISSYLYQAIRNLQINFLRSMLTLLGVLIGTASIVALLSGSTLATETALAQFKKLGVDILGVSVSKQDINQPSINPVNFTQSGSFFSKDIISITPYTLHYSPAVFQTNQKDITVLGANHYLQTLMQYKMRVGRFISDLDKSSFYCVLGNDLANEISHDPDGLIGQQVRINSFFFTIVGILDKTEKNLFLLADSNQTIIIPLLTSLNLYKKADINQYIFKIAPSKNNQQIELQLKKQLENLLPNTQLSFRSPELIIKNMQEQSRSFQLLLGLIGAITLLVGGIGVMNIMLVSVIERRQEIGLRMAVGASKKNILYLFLIEAAVLTLIGGIMGVLVGEIISYLAAKFSNWVFHLVWLPIVVGFFVSVLVGIFFGYYPAQRASRLNPIDILRSS